MTLINSYNVHELRDVAVDSGGMVRDLSLCALTLDLSGLPPVAFNNCEFSDVVFTVTESKPLVLLECKLRRCRFASGNWPCAYLDRAVLEECHLQQTCWSELFWSNVQWLRCDCRCGTFGPGVMLECPIEQCSLDNSRFQQLVIKDCQLLSEAPNSTWHSCRWVNAIPWFAKVDPQLISLTDCQDLCRPIVSIPEPIAATLPAPVAEPPPPTDGNRFQFIAGSK